MATIWQNDPARKWMDSSPLSKAQGELKNTIKKKHVLGKKREAGEERYVLKLDKVKELRTQN